VNPLLPSPLHRPYPPELRHIRCPQYVISSEKCSQSKSTRQIPGSTAPSCLPDLECQALHSKTPAHHAPSHRPMQLQHPEVFTPSASIPRFPPQSSSFFPRQIRWPTKRMRFPGPSLAVLFTPAQRSARGSRRPRSPSSSRPAPGSHSLFTMSYLNPPSAPPWVISPSTDGHLNHNHN
jgi:hypothetical protein